MTTAELISKLSELPPGTILYVYTDDCTGWQPVSDVSEEMYGIGKVTIT